MQIDLKMEEVANLLNKEMKLTIKIEKERRDQEFINFKKQQEKVLVQLVKQQQTLEKRLRNTKHEATLNVSTNVGIME